MQHSLLRMLHFTLERTPYSSITRSRIFYLTDGKGITPIDVGMIVQLFLGVRQSLPELLAEPCKNHFTTPYFRGRNSKLSEFDNLSSTIGSIGWVSPFSSSTAMLLIAVAVAFVTVEVDRIHGARNGAKSGRREGFQFVREDRPLLPVALARCIKPRPTVLQT